MPRPLIIGLLRFRNAAPYLDRLIPQLRDICDHALVVDDGSTDATVSILKKNSDFFRVHENVDGVHHGGRDWIFLWKWARDFDPQWVYTPDADELLASCWGENGLHVTELVRQSHPYVLGYSFPFYNLWDSPSSYRTDQHYGSMQVIRLMRYNCNELPEDRASHAQALPPTYDRRRMFPAPVKMLHYGYLTPEQRRAKYEFYRQRDPDPLAAGSGGDSYEHMLEAHPTLASWEAAKLPTQRWVFPDAGAPSKWERGLSELVLDNRLGCLDPAEHQDYLSDVFKTVAPGGRITVLERDWDVLSKLWQAAGQSLEDQATLMQNMLLRDRLSCFNMDRLNTLLYFAGFREIQRIPYVEKACELNVMARKPRA